MKMLTTAKALRKVTNALQYTQPDDKVVIEMWRDELRHWTRLDFIAGHIHIGIAGEGIEDDSSVNTSTKRKQTSQG